MIDRQTGIPVVDAGSVVAIVSGIVVERRLPGNIESKAVGAFGRGNRRQVLANRNLLT